MASILLTVTAYTAVVTIILYLVSYSRIYDWWRNTLGIVMNISLFSTIFVALGSTLILVNPDVSKYISSFGWVLLSVALMARLSILISSAKKRRIELDNIAKETRKGK